MQRKNFHSYIYYTALGLLLAAVYLIQSSTALLPRVMSVRPAPAFILMLCIAAFAGESACVLFGLTLGIATDVCSAAPDGFNAVTMMIMGLACSLLAKYVFSSTLPAASVLCGIFTALYYLLSWIVCVFSRGYDGAWQYLWRFSLPGAVYTWLFVFLFWPLVRSMSRRSGQPRRLKNWE